MKKKFLPTQMEFLKMILVYCNNGSVHPDYTKFISNLYDMGEYEPTESTPYYLNKSKHDIQTELNRAIVGWESEWQSYLRNNKQVT